MGSTKAWYGTYNNTPVEISRADHTHDLSQLGILTQQQLLNNIANYQSSSITVQFSFTIQTIRTTFTLSGTYSSPVNSTVTIRVKAVVNNFTMPAVNNTIQFKYNTPTASYVLFSTASNWTKYTFYYPTAYVVSESTNTYLSDRLTFTPGGATNRRWWYLNIDPKKIDGLWLRPGTHEADITLKVTSADSLSDTIDTKYTGLASSYTYNSTDTWTSVYTLL